MYSVNGDTILSQQSTLAWRWHYPEPEGSHARFTLSNAALPLSCCLTLVEGPWCESVTQGLITQGLITQGLLAMLGRPGNLLMRLQASDRMS